MEKSGKFYSQGQREIIFKGGKIGDVDFNYANLMYHDTKNIKISLKKGKRQTMAINELDMHLQKLIKHCREAQADMIED